ncbi:hypothetical protein [Anaeromyxobacter terrae]|uniref:hypothetical protein n=1 Tax=Anaeromyxobacter terrae TaxID=2925406 RepID=UPI001F587503|nr:hypothetical protein [Anaeromyxobacter sp. SG22]
MTGLLALALAGTILLPPWPLSPDGEVVAVPGGAELRVEPGAVERVAPGLWRVVPAEGAHRVVLLAGDARVEAEVEPGAGEIAIAADRSTPLKREGPIGLTLEARGPDGAPDPAAATPLLVAAPGRISAPTAAGPGRWRATYTPAAGPRPEVAVVVALSPRCPLCPTPRAAGGAALPIAAAVELPGRSEPGARTTVIVAERSYDAVADGSGRFRVPIVIPPGVRTARAVALDAAGNRSETEIDLRLPAGDGSVACLVFPRALRADGLSEASVHCLSADAQGRPAPEAPLEVSAAAGAVGRLVPWRGALQRARYRAPAAGAGKGDAIVVRHGAAESSAPVALAPGPPARIELTLAREPVPLGATVAAEAVVRDARGEVLGRASGSEGCADGLVGEDRLVAPRAAPEWRTVVPLRFALSPGNAATSVTLRREGSRWIAAARTVDGRPAAGVALRFGSGARGTTDAHGEASAPAAGRVETVEVEGGARAAGWEGIAPPLPPIALARDVEVALRPASPVDVVAWLDGRVLAWRVEDSGGRPLPGRRVVLRARGVAVGPAEPAGGEGRAPLGEGKGSVAVVDAETGVAAVLEVPR